MTGLPLSRGRPLYLVTKHTKFNYSGKGELCLQQRKVILMCWNPAFILLPPVFSLWWPFFLVGGGYKHAITWFSVILLMCLLWSFSRADIVFCPLSPCSFFWKFKPLSSCSVQGCLKIRFYTIISKQQVIVYIWVCKLYVDIPSQQSDLFVFNMRLVKYATWTGHAKLSRLA